MSPTNDDRPAAPLVGTAGFFQEACQAYTSVYRGAARIASNDTAATQPDEPDVIT